MKVKLKLHVSDGVQDARFFLGLVVGWIVGAEMSVDVLLSAPSDGFELRSVEQMRRLAQVLQSVTLARKEGKLPAVSSSAQPATSDDPCSPAPSDTKPKCLQRDPPSPIEADSSGNSALPVLTKGLRCKDNDLVAAACKVLQDPSEVHAKIKLDKDCITVNLKWGGELTQVGGDQARNLGRRFRQAVYPHEDMAHMHASLRHDLKVHSSNEPRCAQTAAAFAQGLLSLQSPLGAVQVSFVRMDGLGRLEGNARTFVHSPLAEVAKTSARALLESGRPIDGEFERQVVCAPEKYLFSKAQLDNCREKFGTVLRHLEELGRAVKDLEEELKLASAKAGQHRKIQEALPLIRQRWDDVGKEMAGEPIHVPPDKVGGILDQAKYDMRHSMPIIEAAEGFEELVKAFHSVYRLSSSIASYAELGEYGTTPEERFEIARAFLQPMLRKLRWDLRVASGAALGEEEAHLRRHNELFTRQGKDSTTSNGEAARMDQPVRSRLYFAHHSQMHTLMNLFRWAPSELRFLSKAGEEFLSAMVLPLGYICHLVLKLWRNPEAEEDSKYTVTLELSSGDEGSSASDTAPVPDSMLLNEGIPLNELDRFLSELLAEKEATSHKGHVREGWTTPVSTGRSKSLIDTFEGAC